MTDRNGVLLRLLPAFMLLALIAWLIDIDDALALLRRTDWRWIVVCLLIVQVQVVLSAVRWQRTAVRLDQKLHMARAIREYYLATLANLSLPGGVTGDAARIYRNRNIATTTVSAQSVMIERLTGQLALLMVTGLGWSLWPLLMHTSAPREGGRLLLLALAILLLIVGLVLFLRRLATNRLSPFLYSFGPALQRVWVQDHQWLPQGLLSLLIVATYLSVFACCALALGQPLSLAAVLAIVPLVLLSMVVPLSVGGWGVREAAAASLWPVAGLTPEAGVATSVLYGLVCLFGTVPGALWSWLIPFQER